MYPLLHDGDVVYYHKVSYSKSKIDDLVLVQTKQNYFTHRLIYKALKYTITKGDNNPRADGKIRPSQIIGRITKVKRGKEVFDPEQLYLIQSTLYFAEIIKIKHAFEQAGINFVYLKGLPLHLYYEKTYPRRIYADCDVLIEKSEQLTAKKILSSFGYKEVNTAVFVSELYRKNQPEFSFVKYINSFSVVFDVHVEVLFMTKHLGSLNMLYPQKLIDKLSAKFLEKKRIVRLKGETWPILSPANLIVYLALHFFHHNYRGAFRLQFLEKVIAKENSRSSKLWLQINKLVKDYNLTNFVKPVLSKHKLKANYSNLEIFSDELRSKAGITRFINLVKLSPASWFSKMMVFINPAVLINLCIVVKEKLKK